MSKNISRKGLALAVITAFGAAAFAGTPAHATVPVSLGDATGTGSSTILGETFKLKTLLTSAAIQAPTDRLKYIITDTSAKLALNAGTISGDTRSATTGVIIHDSGVAVAGTAAGNSALNFTSTGTTAFSVTVQAFVDFNGNNAVDAGEATSDVRTINFVTLATAAPAAALTVPAVTDTTLTAKVNFASDVNVGSINPAHFAVQYYSYDANGLVATAIDSNADNPNNITVAGVTGPTDATTNAFTSSTPSLTPAAGTLYGAQAVEAITNPATGGVEASGALLGGWTKVGSVSKASTASATIDAISNPAITASNNVNGLTIRPGAGSYVASAKATKATVAVANQVSTTVTVSASIASATESITVAGKVLTQAAPSATVTVTSDASGLFNFPVSASAGTAGDSFTIDAFQVVGQSATYTTASTTFTFTALTDASFVVVDTTANGTQQIVKGGAASVNYSVVDQYGAPVDGASYRLYSTVTGGASTQYVATSVTAGKATVSFTDNSTAAGSLSVATKLQKLSNLNWVDVKSANATTINVLDAAAATPVTLTLAGTGVAFNAVDTKNVNTAATPLVAAPTFTNYATLTANVKDGKVSPLNVAGVAVTFSAAGVQFKSGSVYSVGSITVLTDASGNAVVSAASNVTGDVTVTATAGSLSKTLVVTYTGSALETTVANAAWTLPSYVVPGAQTVTASVKLTDKYGNVVPVSSASILSLKASGLGTAGAAGTTSPAGVVTANTVLVAADAGTITFTLTYDANANGTVDTGDFTVVKTVKVANATVSAKASTGSAQVGSAVTVTVTVVDANGAVVPSTAVTFANNGAGYLVAGSATTNASGVATVQLVGNVGGSNSVVASAAGGSSAPVAVDFGNSDATLSVSGKRVTAAWSFAAGKKVVVSVNGKRVKSVVAADDTADSFSFNAKKGTNKVTVSVAGVVTDSLTVKVKK